jgi:hypothetical protein
MLGIFLSNCTIGDFSRRVSKWVSEWLFQVILWMFLLLLSHRELSQRLFPLWILCAVGLWGERNSVWDYTCRQNSQTMFLKKCTVENILSFPAKTYRLNFVCSLTLWVTYFPLGSIFHFVKNVKFVIIFFLNSHECTSRFISILRIIESST